MIKSESIAKLADALSKAQKEMKNAIKDSDNPFFKSKYADLASVREVYQGPLSDHGLALVQIPETSESGLPMVTTILLHTSGEFIGGSLSMNPVKADPQGIGSAITYARRYQASGITGIATELDDDGNAASGNTGKSNVKRIEEDIPLTPAVESHIVAPVKDRITPEQAGKWAERFRKALPEDMQSKSDSILADWLGSKLYVDEQGNPSKLAVRKEDYERIGKESIAFAKSFAPKLEEAPF